MIELSRDEEISGIENALDALLRAALEADANRPPNHRGDELRFTIWSIADLEAYSRRSEPARRADALIANPVGDAARQAVRMLGKRLDELGGHELMGKVCERVADLDPANWGRRVNIMDHRWDGIGSWYA